jgi:hypothetical protein
MALYLVERNYGEELRVDKAAVEEIIEVNDSEDVRWLHSFVTADKKRSYCLMEAPSAEAVASVARRNNLPADVITEVGEFRPDHLGL